MGIWVPPSWNIWLQPATNPVIPGRPRVSAVLLDRINIRLMGADGPTEACEDQQRAKWEGRGAEWGRGRRLESAETPMHLQAPGGSRRKHIQQTSNCLQDSS